jgi:hypothetical protein
MSEVVEEAIDLMRSSKLPGSSQSPARIDAEPAARVAMWNEVHGSPVLRSERCIGEKGNYQYSMRFRNRLWSFIVACFSSLSDLVAFSSARASRR